MYKYTYIYIQMQNESKWCKTGPRTGTGKLFPCKSRSSHGLLRAALLGFGQNCSTIDNINGLTRKSSNRLYHVWLYIYIISYVYIYILSLYIYTYHYYIIYIYILKYNIISYILYHSIYYINYTISACINMYQQISTCWYMYQHQPVSTCINMYQLALKSFKKSIWHLMTICWRLVW